MESYDVIVIGGGHAGCEAAMAAAKLGCRTLLVTMDMAKVAAMSCNPAIGGVAKGQIVREIDALGGQMGIVADLCTLQFRMLNRSKGPAMWSPRAQCDKSMYVEEWRDRLMQQENLYIWQDSVVDLTIVEGENGKEVRGVKTLFGVEFEAKTVVLTAGTFLSGIMHCGRVTTEGGRAGDPPSKGVTECLQRVGIQSNRMKTGTPVRIDGRTIDFSVLERQEGDDDAQKFSFSDETEAVREQLPCYIAYTTPQTHAILRSAFDDSPLFNGTIKGIGPRYCPSIEDKLRTFADKEQHQLFLEPEGAYTNEYYLNGFSSSLPYDVQLRALRSIAGFENAQIYRPGYAIEYDYFPPEQLHHSLESRTVQNLYFAGQVNGTTGYEEAAAQGLMAGINAARKVRGLEPIVLQRDQAYIGVLIDDLITKGVDEPYRMFTSRAEYRITLRQDNAEQRLTPLGYEIGLISEERYQILCRKNSMRESIISYLKQTSVHPWQVQPYFEEHNLPPLNQGCKLYDLALRTDITIMILVEAVDKFARYVGELRATLDVLDSIDVEIKYSGYIERERQIAEKLRRLEHVKIPADIDYEQLQSLTIEARQKLKRHRPATIAEASRIPGVSPADINVLLIRFGR